MPKRKYALENDGPQRLEINWRGGLYYHEDGFRVLLDGNQIGAIPASVDLKQGWELTMPDASIVSVKLEKGELRVFRNGRDLASVEHPQRILTFSWSMLALLGIIETAGGILMALGIVKDQNPIPTSELIFICGILFLGLSWWARSKSIVAFIFGMALYAIQIAVIQVFRGEFDFWVTLTFVWMLPWCLDGIGAIRKISRQVYEK